MIASAPISPNRAWALAMRWARSSAVMGGAGFGQGLRLASSASAVDPPMPLLMIVLRSGHATCRQIEQLAMAGSQDFAADPRNADLRIYVNGELVPRAEAKVSVFDAGFVLGDGVWEGLRLHNGVLLF